MVDKLRDHHKIADARVLDAIFAVPRDFFVAEALKHQAYKDNALPIAAQQTISQPYIVARMSELIGVDEKSRVLEIGAGSGYQSAVLSQIAGRVFAIERIPLLAAEAERRLNELGIRNVTVKCGDGTKGWDTYAPYDAILVAAGGPEIPTPLVEQLKIGGRLVIPVGSSADKQNLTRVTRTATGFTQENCGPCVFVPLIGEFGWKQQQEGK
jgi:protein-L-isoaspartate(D-aspartate) O-methyltransferase